MFVLWSFKRRKRPSQIVFSGLKVQPWHVRSESTGAETIVTLFNNHRKIFYTSYWINVFSDLFYVIVNLILFYIKQFDTETKQSAALKSKNPQSAEQKRKNQGLLII